MAGGNRQRDRRQARNSFKGWPTYPRTHENQSILLLSITIHDVSELVVSGIDHSISDINWTKEHAPNVKRSLISKLFIHIKENMLAKM